MNIMYCAFCVALNSKTPLHEDHEAITIANGHAVCEHHLKYISHYNGTHSDAVRFMIRKSKEEAERERIKFDKKHGLDRITIPQRAN